MIGRTIGNYRIVEKLGKGATGTLFKAIDETLGREVAIKVLHPDLAETDVMKRFQAEVKALARLNHPEIATIHDVQIGEDAVLLVTELVRGEDLDALVRRVGPLPPERAALLLTQILSALAHAHQVDVVHRDLKSSNVIVTELGTVKLLDFAMAPVEGASQMTAASFALGTPAYMAPERILGNEVDARADVYSVGVIFYYLLTGKLPFEASSATEMARKQLSDPPTPLSAYRADLPPWCQAILDRALAKSPEERFLTAADFRAALLDGISGVPTEATGAFPIRAVVPPGGAPPLVIPSPALVADISPPVPTTPTVDPNAPTFLTAIPPEAFQPAVDDPTAPVDPYAATVLTAMPVFTEDGGSWGDAAAPAGLQDADLPPTLGATILQSPDAMASAPGDAPTILVPAGMSPSVAAPASMAETAAASTPNAPAPGLVMKRNQFAAAGLTLGALAFGVVVLVAVVLRRSAAEPPAAPATVAESRPAAAPPAMTPTPAPEVPEPPSSTPAPAVERPARVPPSPPLEISEPPLRTPDAAPATPARPGPEHPAPAAADAVPEPAAPAPANPNLGRISNTTPFKFQGRAVVVDGDKRRERDASITLADGAVNVVFADGKGAYAVAISDLVGITYSNSRQPLWLSPDGPAEAMRVEGGFFRGRRNWLGFRTPDTFMVLRIDDGIVGRVLAGVQERTGLAVARLVEPKQ